MSFGKFNINISLACILQMWAYEKIVVIQSVRLQRARDDSGNIGLTYWVSRGHGYMYPHTLETRR